jgi:hypothetical protein
VVVPEQVTVVPGAGVPAPAAGAQAALALCGASRLAAASAPLAIAMKDPDRIGEKSPVHDRRTVLHSQKFPHKCPLPYNFGVLFVIGPAMQYAPDSPHSGP